MASAGLSVPFPVSRVSSERERLRSSFEPLRRGRPNPVSRCCFGSVYGLETRSRQAIVVRGVWGGTPHKTAIESRAKRPDCAAIVRRDNHASRKLIARWHDLALSRCCTSDEKTSSATTVHRNPCSGSVPPWGISRLSFLPSPPLGADFAASAPLAGQGFALPLCALDRAAGCDFMRL